jgi:hypothetical protein
MARPGSANIRSPEAIRRFRFRFVEFTELAHLALDTAAGDVRSVNEWLRHEQLPYWQREHRRRHEELGRTWREYVNARYGDRRMGKPSCVDERKAWERARRMKEEAERKIEFVKGWLRAVERETDRLKSPCSKLQTLLDSLAPRALVRLDTMLDGLDEYLRAAGHGRTGAPPRDTSEPEGREDAEDQPGGGNAEHGAERSET